MRVIKGKNIMFKSILSYFFRDRENELNAKIERLEALNSKLYDELEAKKCFELDYKLIKAYVDDDDAILELLGLEKKREEFERDQSVSAEYWRDRCEALERELATRENNVYEIKRQQVLAMQRELEHRQRSQACYPTAYSEGLHREMSDLERQRRLSMMNTLNTRLSPSQLYNAFNSW